MLAQTETHTHTQHRCIQSHKESRREKNNGCFFKRLLLASETRVKTWMRILQIDRDNRSSVSQIHCRLTCFPCNLLHCGALGKIILLWLAGKRLLCCSSCLHEGREHMPHYKWCPPAPLLCQTLDYVQHYPPPPLTQIKGFLSPPLLSKIIGFMTVDFRKVPRQFWWLLSTPAGLEEDFRCVRSTVLSNALWGSKLSTEEGKKRQFSVVCKARDAR